MSKRLVFLLAPVIVLAVVYALVMRSWLLKQESESEASSAMTEATAAFVEETLSETEEIDLDRDEPIVTTVPLRIEVTEYAGRRIEVSGRITTLDEKRRLLESIKADLPEAFNVDDRVTLDYQCGGFVWLDALDRVDFAVIQQIRRFRLTLSNESVKVSGMAARAAEMEELERRLRQGIPSGVAFESELQVARPPLASLSVWSSPDSTVLLSGVLPEGAERVFLEIVKSSVPGARVVSDLLNDRFAVEPSWQERITTFLPDFLQSVQRASFTIEEGNRVKIAGLAQAAALAGLRRKITSSFPSPPFELELDLQLGVLQRPLATGGSGEAVATPAETLAEMVRSMKIFFPRGRARASSLAQEERDKLDRLGRQWKKENFTGKVFVFGFTDASGDAATNDYVSGLRCRNVVSYLRRNHGLDDSQFEAVGIPENHPPETGLADRLRRVEFGFAEEPSQQLVLNWSAELGAPNQLLKPVKAEELFAEIGEITFAKGKVTPAYEVRQKLQDLASAMVLEKRNDVLVVYGFSDNKGSAAANRWYTEERCKAVAAELVKVGFLEEQIVLRPVLPARPKEEPGADEGVDPEADDGESGDEEEDPKLNPRRVRLVLMPKENFEASEQVTREAAEEEVQEAEGESSGESGADEPGDDDQPPAPAPDSGDVEAELDSGRPVS